MKAIFVLFDSLNRHLLPNYGCDWTKMPNFRRLGEKTLTFDRFYGGSMPCMPARRELHTGRYNFLHRSWSPLEPFDDSVIERLRKAGVYTHITTDHFHYWEDGGANYLTKFDSFEMVRGQQGDPWIGQVRWPEFPETLSNRKTTQNWRHDWINRSVMQTDESMPQHRTMTNGFEFIDRNHRDDQWFLQIEVFDPHEPFFTQQKYKDLYPHDYEGLNMDWPNYGRNDLDAQATEHVRMEYAALMSMCDDYLGRLLDKMDAYDLWQDTLLVVCTDHGFMLGEKECMGKNVIPFYNEIINTPFFIHDPRSPRPNERCPVLAQTIDLVPTLAEYFQIEPPQFMDGRSLEPAIRCDEPIRDYALFGVHGGHVNITDGRYVYMHAPVHADNKPLYEYTLMPSHMNVPFSVRELQETALVEGFPFTQGCPVLKISAGATFNAYWSGTQLYDLDSDPKQKKPIIDDQVQLRLLDALRRLMLANQAPLDQFERLGIPQAGEITADLLPSFRKMNLDMELPEGLTLTPEGCKAVAIFTSTLATQEGQAFLAELTTLQQEDPDLRPVDLPAVLELVKKNSLPQFRKSIAKMILTYI